MYGGTGLALVSEHDPQGPEPTEPGGGVAPEDRDHVLRAEASLGTSPRGMAANGLLRALSKAARSILLYDPGNEAVRTFIDEYRAASAEALALGPLMLEIRPFEILLKREIVYLERDRERSLAFRMFRDGVRRLTISPEVAWDELFHMLEILSIRYTGVRQTEDDIVTLLWKAGFQHIEVVAVEGFVPEEEAEPAGEGRPMSAAGSELFGMQQAAGRVDVPRDWDLPIEGHTASDAPLVYEVVPREDLKVLRDEVASVHLAEHALLLAREMLVQVRDPTDPTSLSDLYHTIGEIRDFLLAEGQIGPLVQLARDLRALDDLVTARLREELGRLADRNALRKVLHSVSRTATEASDELMQLLDLVPGDHLASLVAFLQVERGAAARRVARQLIERYVTKRLEYLRKSLTDAEPRVAGDILTAVCSASPQLGLQLSTVVVAHPAPEIQSAVLEIVQAVDPAESDTEHLLALLASAEEHVRLEAIGKLGQRADRRSFRRLSQRLERGDTPSWTEAEALGRALARINPRRAFQELHARIQPPGWWARFKVRNASPEYRQTVAIAAFGELETQEAGDALLWLAKRSGSEVREQCKRALRQHSAEGRGNE